jgi:hypothetical protein
MNKYDFGTDQNASGTAWKAWFREIKSGKNTVIIKDGKPIIYSTELCALKAAAKFFLNYLNTGSIGFTSNANNAKAKAEELFKRKE